MFSLNFKKVVLISSALLLFNLVAIAEDEVTDVNDLNQSVKTGADSAGRSAWDEVQNAWEKTKDVFVRAAKDRGPRGKVARKEDAKVDQYNEDRDQQTRNANTQLAVDKDSYSTLDHANKNLNDKYNDYDKKIADGQVQLNKLSKDLETAQAEYDKLNQAALKDREIVDGRSVIGNLIHKKPKSIKEAREKEKEKEKLQKEIAKIKGDIGKFHDKIVKTCDEVTENEQKMSALQEKIAKDKEVIAGLPPELSEDATYQLHVDAAREFFQKEGKTYFNARLLMTDISRLKGDTQALQEAFDMQLNTTLMGQYVNGQIQKLGSHFCDLQNQCAGKEAADLSSTIEGYLNTPRSGTPASTDGNKGEDEEAEGTNKNSNSNSNESGTVKK